MFAGRSFAVRLTLLIGVVSGLAVVVVATAMLVLEARRVHAAALETARAHARVIAANSTAALDFEDEEAARATLAGLAGVPEFIAAEIRRPDGSILARYERSGVARPAALSGDRSTVRIDGRWLALPQPIVRDREIIGNLTLLYDLAPARRRLLYHVGVVGGITGIVIVLSFLAARGVQRSLLRPVRELSRAAETIASTDDYNIRARKYSSDELGVLTDVFNAMIERINEAESLRRDHQAMLEREVAERTVEIIEAQSRLRQAERMASLGTLSAGLGHDIGNILMPLRAHVSMIRDSIAREPAGRASELEGNFTAVAKATEYLQNLSAGLRLLAQDPERAARAGERTLIADWWIVTDPLLRAVVGSGITLEHDFPADLPPVKIARHLLTQAVLNLVQNAAQAMTPDGGPPAPGGRIRVWARQVDAGDGDRRVLIAVSDNGPGMTDEVMRRCMEPYFTTGTRRISSGLGLPLVKGIAENVGGTLEVETRLGHGSTFTLQLPAESPAPRPKARAVVTIGEPRRKALVSHLLASLNWSVQAGPSGGGPAAASPERDVWATDSLDEVPAEWPGRILLFAEAPSPSEGGGDRITVLDPSAPVPTLRRALQQVLAGR